MDMVRKLPNVRKVSMSPWVDVRRGAERIGGDFVFSRKPSPAQVAVDNWSPGDVEQHLREALDACREFGCPCELILKEMKDKISSLDEVQTSPISGLFGFHKLIWATAGASLILLILAM